MEKRETERVLTYTGEEPADGALPAFYTNIDEQGNVLFLDEERPAGRAPVPAHVRFTRTSPTASGSRTSSSRTPLHANGIGR